MEIFKGFKITEFFVTENGIHKSRRLKGSPLFQTQGGANAYIALYKNDYPKADLKVDKMTAERS